MLHRVDPCPVPSCGGSLLPERRHGGRAPERVCHLCNYNADLGRSSAALVRDHALTGPHLSSEYHYPYE